MQAFLNFFLSPWSKVAVSFSAQVDFRRWANSFPNARISTLAVSTPNRVQTPHEHCHFDRADVTFHLGLGWVPWKGAWSRGGSRAPTALQLQPCMSPGRLSLPGFVLWVVRQDCWSSEAPWPCHPSRMKSCAHPSCPTGLLSPRAISGTHKMDTELCPRGGQAWQLHLLERASGELW